MRRVVISTIGTSLLTNQINRANSEEKDWYNRLRDTANLRKKEIEEKHPDVEKIMLALRERADNKLKEGTIQTIRGASAELNGIYGLYQAQLEQGKQDIHWLIPTDTAQGKVTAEIVQFFLQAQGLNVSIYDESPGISTASTGIFSDGIDKLISWLRETLPPFKQSGYKVYFNLVGSFKSLQGYLNTIGMFYADEIIYIFEGANSELITIPRLPVTVDYSVIEPYKMQLALMNAGAEIPVTDAPNILEGLVYKLDGEMTLSNWGKLVWSECKQDLLSQDLLPFPRLQYLPSFVADYRNIRDKGERLVLQETLAKVSKLLNQSNGDSSLLKKDGGLQYDKYTNKGNIDHFRVTQGLRVSCISTGGTLQMRRYGSEPDVNNNP